MKKITREAVSAFYAGEKYNKSNTMVTQVFTDAGAIWSVMSLFGNQIAKKVIGKTDYSSISDAEIDAWIDKVYITTAGWNTVTTKERLNGLKGVRVSTRGGVLMLNGEPWDGGMYEVLQLET